MDIRTSKLELINMIIKIENFEFIEKLKEMITLEKTDFWDELSISEKY